MVQTMAGRGDFESLAIQTNIQHISYLYCESFGEKYSGSGSSPSCSEDEKMVKSEPDSSCDTFEERKKCDTGSVFICYLS